MFILSLVLLLHKFIQTLYCVYYVYDVISLKKSCDKDKVMGLGWRDVRLFQQGSSGRHLRAEFECGEGMTL